MANLPEDSSTFDATIYQIETTDPVVGGVNGVSNVQAKALANRTAFLKAQLDALIAGGGSTAEIAAAIAAHAAGEQLTNGTDWNTLTTPGLFTLNATGLNAPPLSSVYIVEVMSIASLGSVRQVAFNTGTNITYTRIYGSGVWFPWESLSAQGSSQLFLQNGYSRLSNGEITQWGYDATPAITGATILFPTAFTNACFSVVCTPIVISAIATIRVQGALTPTGFTYEKRDFTGNLTTSAGFFWQAKGW